MLREIQLRDLGHLLREAGAVFLPGTAGEPVPVIDAMAENLDWSQSLSVISGFVAGINRPNALRVHPGTQIQQFFPDQNIRGNVKFTRCSYYEIDRQLKSKNPAMAFITVNEPNHKGLCNQSVAADFGRTALELADIRVALINPLAPGLLNGCPIPLERFTHVLRHPFPLIRSIPVRSDDKARQIARHIASYIGDGATIQIGIGKVPVEILAQVRKRKRLRLHSGILPGAVRQLCDEGALAAGASICCASLLGDSAFYKWLHGNGRVQLEPVSFTHAPATLQSLSKLIAINSALEVDLAGRVNAEWLGRRRVSAPGGLPDFAGAARRSRDGISIIALPATDFSRQHSRIVKQLAAHVAPTVTGSEVDMVVTEYGVADLRGCDENTRAKRLVRIAAPEHRASLYTAA